MERIRFNPRLWTENPALTVVTEKGEPAQILTTDGGDYYPVIALVTQDSGSRVTHRYDENGEGVGGGETLYFANEQKRYAHLAIVKTATGYTFSLDETLYDDRATAEETLFMDEVVVEVTIPLPDHVKADIKKGNYIHVVQNNVFFCNIERHEKNENLLAQHGVLSNQIEPKTSENLLTQHVVAQAKFSWLEIVSM